MRGFVIAGFVSSICLVSSYGSHAEAAELKVWFGTSVTGGSLKPLIESFSKDTGIQIVMPSDNNKANAPLMFKDLVAGTVEGAALASPYTEWLKSAKTAGVTDKQASEITSRVIARDEMEFFVHKDNPVAALSMDDLAKILSGSVKNWKEVRGKDTPIQIFVGNKPTTLAYIKKAVMDGKEYPADMQSFAAYAEAVEKVATNEGGISFGPKGTANATVRIPKLPEISRPVTVISKGKPSENLQKFIEYIRARAK